MVVLNEYNEVSSVIVRKSYVYVSLLVLVVALFIGLRANLCQNIKYVIISEEYAMTEYGKYFTEPPEVVPEYREEYEKPIDFADLNENSAAETAKFVLEDYFGSIGNPSVYVYRDADNNEYVMFAKNGKSDSYVRIVMDKFYGCIVSVDEGKGDLDFVPPGMGKVITVDDELFGKFEAYFDEVGYDSVSPLPINEIDENRAYDIIMKYRGDAVRESIKGEACIVRLASENQCVMLYQDKYGERMYKYVVNTKTGGLEDVSMIK